MIYVANKTYDCVAFPAKGIGTGLAKLKEKAPNTFDYLFMALYFTFSYDNRKGQFVDTNKSCSLHYNFTHVKRKTVDCLSVELVRDNPNCLFVYGDNALRYGKRGQAIIRDEPNAFGIVTKLKPSTASDAYMTDKDSYKKNQIVMSKDIRWIIANLNVTPYVYSQGEYV